MTAADLADTVLPLIRSRADLHRLGIANRHGRQMHQGVDILEAAVDTADPPEVFTVTQRALSSALKVIMRADDSSGIIGDACRRLLALHPKVAATARVPAGKLVEWMMKFQFDGVVDFFEIDPVAYAPALGEAGLASYRERLRGVENGLGPRPQEAEKWSSTHSHEWFTLDWNAERLAVLDRDVEAIIRTHAKDRRVAAWLEHTAQAFEEIGDIDRAIDWAQQATEFDDGHQSLAAGDYWGRLLEEHSPGEALAARLAVFRRWPSATTADRLQRVAGAFWPEHRQDVLRVLEATPSEAVTFAMCTLEDVELAWHLAETLDLQDGDVWSRLLKAYDKIDPAATLPVHAGLVKGQLEGTGPRYYRAAARRLAEMRKLAGACGRSGEIDEFVAELREQHRRRPRLQQEFDRAGLP